MTIKSIPTALAFLALTSSAHASGLNTTNPRLDTGIQNHSEIEYLRLFDVSARTLVGDRFLGSSRTATLYYKKGVKNFEKGNLEKAEQHFRASLRAHGSKGLDKATLHYLVNVSHQLGDTTKAKAYAQDYYNLK